MERFGSDSPLAFFVRLRPPSASPYTSLAAFLPPRLMLEIIETTDPVPERERNHHDVDDKNHYNKSCLLLAQQEPLQEQDPVGSFDVDE